MDMRVTEHDMDGDTHIVEIAWSHYLYYVRVPVDGEVVVYRFTGQGRFVPIHSRRMVRFAEQYVASLPN